MNEILGFINDINELINDGYIEIMRSKGRYIITEKGFELLKKMSLES